MPLNDKQRAELEALTPETVRIMLLQSSVGREAVVRGFKTATFGGLFRGDVEDWLAEKGAQEATERRQTLRWAIIAGVAAIASVLVGIVTLLFTVLLVK